MAIRYSGEVEIRISYKGGRYIAKLRAPGFRATGGLSLKEIGLRVSPTSSEAYDKVALILLREAHAKAPLRMDRNGKTIQISRIFRSPCPAPRSGGKTRERRDDE